MTGRALVDAFIINVVSFQIFSFFLRLIPFINQPTKHFRCWLNWIILVYGLKKNASRTLSVRPNGYRKSIKKKIIKNNNNDNTPAVSPCGCVFYILLFFPEKLLIIYENISNKVLRGKKCTLNAGKRFVVFLL